MVKLRLSVQCGETNWGESVAVVGSWSGWDQQKCILLTTDANSFPEWSGSLDVEAGKEVEYKYVLLKDGKILRWESDGKGMNRKVMPCGEVVHDGFFGNISEKVWQKEPLKSAKSVGTMKAAEAAELVELAKAGKAGKATKNAKAAKLEEKVDLGHVEIELAVKDAKLDEFENAVVNANAQFTSWRQRLSFVRSLFTDRNAFTKYGFDENSVEHLTTVCIYLTYLMSGQIRCEDTDGHHRPSHHAMEAREIEASLNRLARESQAKWIPYLIRRIYPCLPSFAPAFTCSVPLTRIRDIAHRNDIPSELKRDIKKNLQNKLHRCAGPEDLRTSERILSKITAPDANYSADFVKQMTIFHKELSEFFNATALDDRLESISNNKTFAGTPDVKNLASKLRKMKRGREVSSAQLNCLTKLRYALAPLITTDRKQAVMTTADLQQTHLLDIALEEYAFTILAAVAACAQKSFTHESKDSALSQCLALAMDNLGLSRLAATESTAAATELRAALNTTLTCSREQELRLRAAVERALRLCETLSVELVDLFSSRLSAFSGALGVSSRTSKVFAEAAVRSHVFFQASRVSSVLMNSLRRQLSLPPWESLRPGIATGKIRMVTSLDELENSPNHIIAFVKSATGDEDVPRNVRAIILGHAVAHLSHLAVRARQAGVVFACAHEMSSFMSCWQMVDGKEVISLSVSEDGIVAIVAAKSPRTPQFAVRGGKVVEKEGLKNMRAQMDATSLRCREICTQEKAKPETCGAKSAFAGILTRFANGSKEECQFSVPEGCAISFGVFTDIITSCLGDRYRSLVEEYMTCKVVASKDKIADRLRQLIESEVQVPHHMLESVRSSFRGSDRLMVRSSANCEDLEDMSGAGLYDSYANVPSNEYALARAICKVWGSLWTRRAARSRSAYALDHTKAAMGVLIQRMIAADLSFITFSRNPVSGDQMEVYVEVVVGMGEALASARFRGNPLRAIVEKKSFNVHVKCFPSFGQKLLPVDEGGLEERSIDYSKERITAEGSFREEILRRIGKIATFLERKLGGPQDIEGVIVGETVYIVQARPMVI